MSDDQVNIVMISIQYIFFYSPLRRSVLHAVPVADLAPVELVHHALIHSLLARVELGVEQAVLPRAGLAGVHEVGGQHQEEVVSEDLRTSPGVLQKSLNTSSSQERESSDK